MHYLQFLLGLLPASGWKNRLLSLTSDQWSIDPSASIGPNVFWKVQRLDVGEAAVVYLANVFRSLRSVRLADGAEIGQLNWISGEGMVAPGAPLDERGTFVVREEAAVTSRHHIDCSGGFEIGRFSILAGVNSQVLTHAVDVRASQQVTGGVRIGDFCFVATRCIISSGVTVADRIVVGAGSVIVKSLVEEESLYAGVPAVRRGSLAGAAFFMRERGRLMTKDEERMARRRLSEAGKEVVRTRVHGRGLGRKPR